MSTPSKKIVITRKIQIIPDYQDKKEFKNAYDTLYKWRNIVYKSANMISTHLFLQDQVKEIVYFTDDIKVKLANIKKDENGILSTSKLNTTYQMLSKQFKGECPMSILSSLNTVISSTYSKNRTLYFKGERSLMNYRQDIPIPVPFQGISNIKKGIEAADENKGSKKDYTFTCFGLNFKTNFGKDLSRNEIIFDRAILGEYKFCDSSIQILGKKLFLLAVFSFDKLNLDIKPDRELRVRLDINHPLIITTGKTEFKIGDRDEFLYRRLAIQEALRRTQKSARFNKGGKGIQKKTAAIEKFKKAEISYVTIRIHAYSKRLIDFAIKEKAGKIVLVNMPEVKTETENDEFLLRNWSYYGLQEKITYKARKYGIEVIG